MKLAITLLIITVFLLKLQINSERRIWFIAGCTIGYHDKESPLGYSSARKRCKEIFGDKDD